MKGPGPLLLIAGAGALILLSKGKTDALKEQHEAELDPALVPKVKEDQVGFSANFENYEIGSSWRIKVLDAYLDSARTEGKLAIADLGSVEYDTPWLAELIVKFGPPASWDLPGTAALNAVLATTRMLVLNDFIGSHYAAIPGGAAPLSAIPESPARDSFMSTISDYAMAFQKRTFS